MTTIELARQLSAAFEERSRPNGETFRALKHNSPDWMIDVSRVAHADMLPDDWRYAMFENAADAIANLNDDDDPEEAEDALEADVYTSELTGWLHSSLSRYAYCDEAIREYGPVDDIIKLLQLGQLAEKREVFGLVLSALRDLAAGQEEIR